MAGDLAAEGGVVLAHADLEEGVPDPVDAGGASEAATVSGTARLARTS